MRDFPYLMLSIREFKAKRGRDSGLKEYGDTGFSGLKFRKFHVLIGTVHSGCKDPTQATARLVIVLVSRKQKSGTGHINFVKWKGIFRSD